LSCTEIVQQGRVHQRSKNLLPFVHRQSTIRNQFAHPCEQQKRLGVFWTEVLREFLSQFFRQGRTRPPGRNRQGEISLRNHCWHDERTQCWVIHYVYEDASFPSFGSNLLMQFFVIGRREHQGKAMQISFLIRTQESRDPVLRHPRL